MEAILDIARAVQASPFGAWARGSSYAYPAANLIHLLGLVMLVGGIGVLDLRLAGFWRRMPVEPLSRALTPMALVGVVLMLPSGATMFASDAATLVQSPVFQAKLVLIALGLANAVAFRAVWRRRLRTWEADPPLVGQLMAAASVTLWLIVAALGRMIAYT